MSNISRDDERKDDSETQLHFTTHLYSLVAFLDGKQRANGATFSGKIRLSCRRNPTPRAQDAIVPQNKRIFSGKNPSELLRLDVFECRTISSLFFV